jgi:uncharacterized membrane protein YeaQ/YmgE (transglycosylase-associated protein family)
MPDTITIQFTVTGVITWIIVGLIAGFLAGLLVRGRGYSTVTSVIVGLVGAFVGGFLVTYFKIAPPAFLAGGITINYFDIVVSFIGAALVLIVLGFLFRHR